MLLAVFALGVRAQDRPADTMVRDGDSHMSRLEYDEALVAYRTARASSDPGLRIRAGAGAVQALLRLGRFAEAASEGADIAGRDPSAAAALAVHADTLWASGLFFEAEARYDEALSIDPADARARHGRGRSRAAQGNLDAALSDVLQAVDTAPREAAYHYTLASIYEHRREFRDAADTLARYLLLLPARDESELAKWAATQETFLRGFGRRTPFEVVDDAESYTVPFRIDNGRLLVDGRVNGRTAVTFTLDTGTDQTILTPALASRAGVVPAATLQTAGVGAIGYGFRGLEIARIDELGIGSLRMRNVSAVIKNPSLVGLPRPEGAAFSPLALGFSMIVDNERRLLTMAQRLPAARYEARLPLRMQRLPVVRVTVNGTTPASFAIDTAGEGTALSRRVAARLEIDRDLRLVPARVFGSAGWDPSAFLLPFVDLTLAQGVGLSNRSLVVLNLDAPSALLGFNLGGIIGQEFLHDYTVALDLERAEVGLTRRR